MDLHKPYDYNTWAKLAQVAAVGNAGKTTSNAHAKWTFAIIRLSMHI